MRVGTIVAAAAALLWASAALAHHSFAMFDMTRKVTLKGVVKEFQWTNPHAWVEMDVVNDEGKTEMWGIEFNSPNNLTRQGWKRTTLKPGDKIIMVVSPLRDGRKGGLFYEVTLPDGKLIQDPSAKNLLPSGAPRPPGSPPPSTPTVPGAPASPPAP